MPENKLPQPASETAAGAPRKPFRSDNLIGGDDVAIDAYNTGATRPSEPYPATEADPFTVRGT